MDTVFVEGIEFQACIGVSDEERSRPQTVRLDVRLTCDLSQAGKSDDLADTVNYVEIFRIAQGIVEEKPYRLVEHLAERLAAALLAELPCHQAWVRVTKPEIFPAKGRTGVPGVEITRQRTR